MDLRQLKTFHMVATTLSFTQAASALGYVQSSVTAQIQALETSLGVPLFDRLGKRVALTDAGVRLFQYAERLLLLAEEARTAVVGGTEPMGALTLSASETLCTYRLPIILQQFRTCYPRVRLLFRPGPVAALRRQVLDGVLDVAFVLEEPIQTTGLVVEPLCPEPVLVIASPDHPLARTDQVRAIDLAGEPILFTELGCSYRNQFERALIAAGVYPATTLEFSSIEAIKQCVMTGMGLSALPAIAVAAELEQGRLVALRWAEQPLEVVMQMIWHKDKWLSPALAAFLDVTHQVLESSGSKR